MAVIESPLPFITAANSVRRGAWARARGMSDSPSERYLLPSRIVLSMVIAAELGSCANVLLRTYCQSAGATLKPNLIHTLELPDDLYLCPSSPVITQLCYTAQFFLAAEGT